MKVLFVSLLFVFFVSSFASAYATCSTDAFDAICRDCSYSAGSADKSCKDSKQSGAEACLAKSYPFMAGKYPLGMCPSLDDCISQLRSCTALRCQGSDLNDCTNPSCRPCYLQADSCALMASMDCDDEQKCGDGKCAKDAGEDQSTCCSDCGCPGGAKCEQNICKTPQGSTPMPNTNLSKGGAGLTAKKFIDDTADSGICFLILLHPLTLAGAALSKAIL